MSEAEQPLHWKSVEVDRTLAPGDGMLDGMLHGEERYYFDSGRSALSVVQRALSIAEAPAPRRILDLPCGHGRVLRFLRAAYPEAELTASDVLEDGVRFCERQFGARGVVAAVDPAATVLDGEFDLIWCGSLLTHLPVAGWEALGSLFARHLAPGGVLVSTLHGRWAETRLRRGDSYGLGDDARRRLLEHYEREGFGYADYEQSPGYGISLSRLSWAAAQIERFPAMRLIWAGERLWDRHQDVLVSQRVREED